MSGQFQLRTAGGAYSVSVSTYHVSARTASGELTTIVVAAAPVAAEAAEDRRVDVHVLAGAGEAAQRQAVDAVGRVVQRLRVGDELVEVSAGLRPFAS